MSNHHPFLIAVSKGCYKEVKEILVERNTGYLVNAKTNANEESPLMIAAYYGRIEVMEILLKYGAKIEDTDKTGRTALFYSTHAPNRKAFDLLIKNNSSVDKICIVSQMECNILMYICHTKYARAQSPYIAELVLIHHIKIDYCNSEDTTALMLCCAKNASYEDLKLLLALRANTQMTDKYEQTTNKKRTPYYYH